MPASTGTGAGPGRAKSSSGSSLPIAIVTGGSSGIGKETVRGLARAGRRVILAGRDPAVGAQVAVELGASIGAPDRIEAWTLDLASLASVRAFGARARAELPRLDVLVCNAGVWPRERRTTADGFELTFGVNHLGHFLLCRELEPLLRASAPARVVVVSSGLHVRARMSWDDLMHERGKFSGTDVYAESKLANILHAFALARRLAGTGVTANALHPGMVRTNLGRELPDLVMTMANPFLRTPTKGAETSIHLAIAPEVTGVTGRYFDDKKVRKPSALAMDRGSQERLWTLSERLVG